ncbi:Detected protein of unknown function [Hibiscus syriacus]|uniref:PPM-type phosphatase domain-containing protein n=1 Tax=Hibiscus syriacus TaxID=106335 RepID=A0A6A3A8V6_HIBSY|nr:Detected protein of unknown function [Hibiscus syriacus]
MGICISVASSEIHGDDDCHQNNHVFLAENASLGIQRLGSLYTKQGSKGLNQDAAILFQDYGMEGVAFCGVFMVMCAFKVMDKEIMLQENLDCSTSGTTAVVVVRQGPWLLALKEEPHIQRVWLPHEDSPGLAMSQAFGDFLLKNHGIIAVPDVFHHHLTPNDQFIVLATDGVGYGMFSTSCHNSDGGGKRAGGGKGGG